MNEPFGGVRRFLRELKRRNVYKVAVTYVGLAFVGLQAVNLLIPATTLPGWADQLFLGLVILGFPVSVVVAWAFEMTAEGMRRTPETEGEPPVSGAYQWIGLVLVVALAGGVWYLTAESGEQATTDTTSATDTSSPTGSTTRDTVRPPRIAVLPFENIARDSSDAFFARGMYEEVRNQLSKVSSLSVLSRKTGVELAESEMTAADIGRTYDVQAILEGSVQRAGGRVQIYTHLIEAPGDEQLWANTYERQLSVEQIFDIQADIAQQIASALETELAEGERQRIESAPTEDLAAYDAYLSGRNSWWRIWTTRDYRHVDRAVKQLRRAVRGDSTFAQAHAWLALAYGARNSISDERRWLDSALVAVERSRTLAPNLAIVRAAEGHVLFWQDSLEAAERVLQEALELQPSNGFTISTLAIVYRRQNERPEQVRWAHRAVQLDPRRAEFASQLGSALRAVGMDAAAEGWLRRARNLDPGHVWALDRLTRVYVERGDFQTARAEVEGFLQANPEHADALTIAAEVALYMDDLQRAKEYFERARRALPQQYPEESPTRPDAIALEVHDRMRLGLVELRMGNTERGRELLNAAADSFRARLERDEGNMVWNQMTLAGGLTALGELEEALRYLDRAVGAGYSFAGWLRTNPLYDNLRTEPRFQKIIRQTLRNQEEYQQEVRQLDIDLNPPGAEPDSVTGQGQTDG